jgi:hypothetical protein
MITTASSVTIDRPQGEVFAFICDPTKAALWHVGVTSFNALDGMPADSQGELTMVIMGRQLHSTFVILENDGAGRTRSRSSQGPIRYETTQLIESTGPNVSRLTIYTRIDAGTVFKLAEPALESIASYHMELDLKTLKAILEAKPS